MSSYSYFRDLISLYIREDGTGYEWAWNPRRLWFDTHRASRYWWFGQPDLDDLTEIEALQAFPGAFRHGKPDLPPFESLRWPEALRATSEREANPQVTLAEREAFLRRVYADKSIRAGGGTGTQWTDGAIVEAVALGF